MADETRQTTPPTATANLPTVSPRKIVTDGGTMAIRDLRPVIASEMDSELLTCSAPDFIAHYMPFAPSDEVVQGFIDDNLKRRGPNRILEYHQVKGEKTLLFKSFTTAPKPRVGVTEATTYEPLMDIAKVIGQYKSFGERKPNFAYRHCPNVFTSSDIAGSKTQKIDACFSIKDYSDILHVTDIAVPIEQKLASSDSVKVENMLQLLSANVHTMNDDPRRRDTYGITIESDQLSLWFNCRSHSTVSEWFKFVDDPRQLIKVFMAFIFATHEELGYDPMVRRNADSTYTYEIPQKDGKNKFYRTEKHLSFFRSNNITGRMTRVWLVKEVSSSGNPIKGSGQYALKDVWLGEKAETEKQILNSIFSDIEQAFWTPDHFQTPDMKTIHDQLAPMINNGSYKKYFMTVVTDHEGKLSPPIAPSAVHKPGLLIKQPRSTTSSHVLGRETTGNSHHVPLQGPAAPTPTLQHPRQYVPRKQYRIVYQEICTDLDGLTTVGEIITALSQVHTALKLLYCAGWVHRDISCGNIMVQNGSGQVKLADLEYAKKFPRPLTMPGAVDPKTGTALFMADEILMGNYIYFKRPPGTATSTDQLTSEYNNIERIFTDTAIVHNFQHDLESLLWIVLYNITFRAKNTRSRWWSDEIFAKRNLSFRHTYFIGNAAEPSLLESVDPTLTDIFSRADNLRRLMLTHYRVREENSKLNNIATYAPTMIAFDRFWSDLELKRREWENTELIDGQLYCVSVSKRSLPDSEVSQGSKGSAKRTRQK